MRSSPSSGQERPTHREHPGFIGIGRVDTPYCSTGSHGRRTPIGITACLVLVLLLQQVSGSLRGQGPAPFEDTFGGLGHERGFGLARVTQCDSGGYIAVGFTESQGSDDENSATWGDVGIYVARTDAFGARLWERRYEIYGLEAELDEVAYNVIELSNAAEYVVVGSAEYGGDCAVESNEEWGFTGPACPGDPRSSFGLQERSDQSYCMNQWLQRRFIP